MEYNFPKLKDLKPIPELPDPFLKPDGSRVATPEEWPEQREYLKELMAHYLYGHMPKDVVPAKGEMIYARFAYEGRAVYETVEIRTGRNHEVPFLVHIIRPIKDTPVPVIVMNQNAYMLRMSDEIKQGLPPQSWNKYTGPWICAVEEELVCERGYALVQFDGDQLAVDDVAGLRGPVASAFPECDWGVIGIWAWGHHCIADYLVSTDWADKDKLVTTGHSRLGKTALCAAIYDERFAVCAPTGSGCGGAGCFRFLGSRYGEGIGTCETAGSINDLLGYFWSDAFGEFGARMYDFNRSTFPEGTDQFGRFLQYYANEESTKLVGKTRNEEYLPFDMHFAKALIAPRGLVTSDAMSDGWANPFGTTVTWRAAQEVFDFLGVPENSVMFFREGPHLVEKDDWLAVLDFCDKYFYGKAPKCHLQTVKHYPKDISTYDKVMMYQDWSYLKVHYDWSNPLEEK